MKDLTPKYFPEMPRQQQLYQIDDHMDKNI